MQQRRRLQVLQALLAAAARQQVLALLLQGERQEAERVNPSLPYRKIQTHYLFVSSGAISSSQ